MEDIDKSNKWIFLIPVDGLSNKNISNNAKEIYEDNKSEKDNSIEENFNKEFFEDNIKENDSNLRENNSKIYSYSFLSKSNIKSIADSSKLYMSEHLKKNWKKKIKRLIIKLKKRYTKQSQKVNSDNNTNNLPDNNTKYIENKRFDFYFNNNLKNFEHHHQNNQANNFNMEQIDLRYNYSINNMNISNNQKYLYNYYIFNHHNNSNINK